jgi:putative transposase
VLTTLTCKRFVDSAPATVYATLLDEGSYLCSTSTMYRVLREQPRERRDQRKRPTYTAPQLLAQRPNEVWSWDITKLLSPRKFEYFHLYVMLDIYSRLVVGWLLAERECGLLAEALIEECCRSQGVTPGSLTIHSDNGAAMTSSPVAGLYERLDLASSFSRPYTSNDNPYSEAFFKTLKYRPQFPKRIGNAEEGRGVLNHFFPWYNTEHRHRGIAYMTPEAVHYGRAGGLQRTRQAALTTGYLAHPGRFPNGAPVPMALPRAAWINAPAAAAEHDALLLETRPHSNEVRVTQRIKVA